MTKRKNSIPNAFVAKGRKPTTPEAWAELEAAFAAADADPSDDPDRDLSPEEWEHRERVYWPTVERVLETPAPTWQALAFKVAVFGRLSPMLCDPRDPDERAFAELRGHPAAKAQVALYDLALKAAEGQDHRGISAQIGLIASALQLVDPRDVSNFGKIASLKERGPLGGGREDAAHTNKALLAIHIDATTLDSKGPPERRASPPVPAAGSAQESPSDLPASPTLSARLDEARRLDAAAEGMGCDEETDEWLGGPTRNEASVIRGMIDRAPCRDLADAAAKLGSIADVLKRNGGDLGASDTTAEHSLRAIAAFLANVAGAAQPAPDPVAALWEEWRGLDAQLEQEEEAADYRGPAHIRVEQIKQMAARTRATTLLGALFQMALASSYVDLVDGAGPNAPADVIERDCRSIDLLLHSALGAVMEAAGVLSDPVIHQLSGIEQEGRWAAFAPAPQLFDAGAYIDRQAVAGATLALQYSEHGRRVAITADDNPAAGEAAAAEFEQLPEWKKVAVLDELQARVAEVEAYPFAEWLSEMEASDAQRHAIPGEGRTEEQTREFERTSDWLDNKASTFEALILKHKALTRVGVAAKLRVALKRLESEGASNWYDEGDVLAIRQAIAWAERTTQPEYRVLRAVPSGSAQGAEPDAELVDLARRFQANRDRFYHLAGSAPEPPPGLATDPDTMTGLTSLAEAAQPLITRSYQLRATTMRGLWAKAVLAEESMPGPETADYTYLDRKLARSLLADIYELGERKGDPLSVNRRVARDMAAERGADERGFYIEGDDYRPDGQGCEQ